MPQKGKEAKSCHDCGLEDITACENSKHRSSRPSQLPCNACKRNVEKPIAHVKTRTFQGFALKEDFYDEQWTLLSDGSPTIEDADPEEQTLLKTLHVLVTEQAKEDCLTFHGVWDKGVR